MALKDALTSFIDNVTLPELFNRKGADVKALRAPLLKGIANAERQFDKGQTRAPNRWWKVNNGVVALTVKVKGDTFDINGVATNHMPEDRFPEFLSRFREAVQAGEFDDELTHKGNGDAQVVIPKASAKNRAAPEREAKSEAAQTRGQKAAATRKANKAARAAQALA